MDATGDDLGSVVGFVPDERSARVGYASDGLLLVGLVCAGAVIFGDSPWWARVLAALLFVACLFGRPSGSLGEGLTLRVSVALMAVALTIVAVVGSLTSSSGIGRAFVLGGIAVSAVGLGLGIVDRRRDQVGWACHAGGLHRTSEAGETVTRFAWSEIATLDYKCTVVTVPVAGGPMVTTEERFGFALHDGPRWSMVLHGTGVPREIHSMGRPSAVSEAILAGVGEAQIGPAEQAIASGDTVAFGPLSVSGQGLGTPGGLVEWADLPRVRIDDWSTRIVYDPHTERVERFIRIFFEISCVVDSAGRPPNPSRWDIPHVPPIDELRRVAVPEGGRLGTAEITAGDWQIPNLPTLLRLLRQRDKLA